MDKCSMRKLEGKCRKETDAWAGLSGDAGEATPHPQQ